MFALLAVLKAVTPTPAAATPAAPPVVVPPVVVPHAPPPASTPLPIRPAEGLVDYPEYPLWMYIVAGLVAAILLGVLVYYIVKQARKPPVIVPPRPRTVALAELGKLRPQAQTLEPYAFSIAVSHVLRRYIEAQFRVPALEQTSPEFIAAIANDVHFSPAERHLLEQFLEVADAIKFARAGADFSVNEALLERAFAFVRGGLVEGAAV